MSVAYERRDRELTKTIISVLYEIYFPSTGGKQMKQATALLWQFRKEMSFLDLCSYERFIVSVHGITLHLCGT